MTSRLRYARLARILFFDGFRIAPGWMAGVTAMLVLGSIASTCYPLGYRLLVEGALQGSAVALAEGVGFVAGLLGVGWVLTALGTTESMALSDRIAVYRTSQMIELISDPRSAETIAAIIGILKCGAAYTMLDSRWPEKRLRKILDQLRAPLTVTDITQKWYGPAISLPSASLFELPGLGRSGASPSAVQSDPCTIFFASGTTGDAKGVIAPHRGIVELFGDCDFADFGTGVVRPQAAPQPWGGFALELWSVLLNGGTSVLIDQPYLFPGTLRSLVQKYGVNSVYLTPSLFNLFVDEDLES